MVTVKFECPYCGEQFVERDDLLFMKENMTCLSCEAAFDDDDLEGIEDVLDIEDEEEAGTGEEELAEDEEILAADEEAEIDDEPDEDEEEV